MSSPSKPIIVVCGATGAQGGSVINSLLHEADKYHLRAITRNSESKKAKELESRGVELIQGDLNKEEDLSLAFANAYGVYAVTNFWDPSIKNPAQEEEQGKLIADVAKKLGVQHFVFSALDDVEKVSNGKYRNVLHFNNKAHVLEYIKSIGLPYTAIKVAFYFENLTAFMGPQKQADGSYVMKGIVRPDTKVPMFPATLDVGPVVSQVFANREKFLGKSIDVASDEYSFPEIAEIMSKVAGIPVRYQYIPPQDLSKELPFIAGNDEMREMLEYFNDFGYFAGRNFKKSRLVDHKFTTLEEFLRKINWKLPQ
ncbi:uncharacterized protein VTP21DRAFT_1507 [Calcarisporiella thermophila]|uniref:uncharacterized protein n=1 Tax=Calcarisporiella thermophila TaxID=911321 RepID=UPI003742C3D6